MIRRTPHGRRAIRRGPQSRWWNPWVSGDRPALPHPARRRRRRPRPRRRVAMAAPGRRRRRSASICATPHIRHDHDVRIAELPGRVAELNAALAAAGPRAGVLPGGEVAETIVERLDDAELRGACRSAAPGAGCSSSRARAAVGLAGRRGRRRSAPAGCAASSPTPSATSRPTSPSGWRLLVAARRARAGHGRARRGAGPAAGMLDLARRASSTSLGSDAHSSRGGRPSPVAARWRGWRGRPVGPTSTGSRATAPRPIVRAGAERRAPPV